MAHVLDFSAAISVSPNDPRHHREPISYEQKLRALESLHPDMAKSIKQFIDVTYDFQIRRVRA